MPSNFTESESCAGMRLRSSDPASDDDLPEEVSLAVAKQAETARVRQQRQSKASRKRKTPHATEHQEPAAAQANPAPPQSVANQPAYQPGAEEDSDELPAHVLEELIQRRRYSCTFTFAQLQGLLQLHRVSMLQWQSRRLLALD